MSMNLILTNHRIDQKARAKADWTALTAISAGDPASPYPTEAYVSVSADAVVAIAALLDDAMLLNGQTVTTYDFSMEDDGFKRTEAHVNAFGPALLDAERMSAVREILAPFPSAIAMLDEVVARGLQISLSTETLSGQEIPHLKGVNWPGDEVEINRCSGNMISMLRDLGLGEHCGDETGLRGEVDFDTFAKAVADRGDLTDYQADRLNAFVACGRRRSATHVHWA